MAGGGFDQAGTIEKLATVWASIDSLIDEFDDGEW